MPETTCTSAHGYYVECMDGRPFPRTGTDLGPVLATARALVADGRNAGVIAEHLEGRAIGYCRPETERVMCELRSPQKPCACPDDAQGVCGGVIITGHLLSCAHGEPRRYVWQEGGHLTVGTLCDYAQAWQLAVMSGDRAALSTEVRTWSESFHVTVKNLGVDDEEDFMRYLLEIGNESVRVHVDGRL